MCEEAGDRGADTTLTSVEYVRYTGDGRFRFSQACGGRTLSAFTHRGAPDLALCVRTV